MAQHSAKHMRRDPIVTLNIISQVCVCVWISKAVFWLTFAAISNCVEGFITQDSCVDADENLERLINGAVFNRKRCADDFIRIFQCTLDVGKRPGEYRNM